MKVAKLIVLGVATFALTACGTTRQKLDWTNANVISSQILVTKDNFKKQILYVGPKYTEFSTGGYVLLRAWKDASNNSAYQIYVKDWYPGEWRFYDSAYDSKGNELDTISIDRKVDSCNKLGCSFEEHVGINVTRNYLMQNRLTGISFKLSGRAGEKVLYIPPAYIEAFVKSTL